ncbi:RNA recognition motif domain, partial [Trinorchestia longiramus]
KMSVVKGFTLFAQNLPKKKTASQVHLHFSKYGKVVACHVTEGKDTYQGAQKNSALVTFENEEDLNKALKAVHVMDSRRVLTSVYVPPKKEKVSND